MVLIGRTASVAVRDSQAGAYVGLQGSDHTGERIVVLCLSISSAN